MTTTQKLMGLGLAPLVAAQIAGDNASSLTATGATQVTALLVSSDIAVVTTAAAGTGVIIQSNLNVNDSKVIANLGVNALLIYPPVGGTINLLAANAGLSVPSGKVAQVWQTSATQFVGVVSA